MTTIDVLIEQKQLTIAEIAERSGLTSARVEAIAVGRWLASPTERKAIAAVLEVQVDDVEWGHFVNPRNIRYRQFGLPEDFSGK